MKVMVWRLMALLYAFKYNLAVVISLVYHILDELFLCGINVYVYFPLYNEVSCWYADIDEEVGFLNFTLLTVIMWPV
jgi:hypothetical protein